MQSKFLKGLKLFKKPEVWISCLGLTVLTVLFVIWFCTSENIKTGGLVAAILSVVLFAAVCLRFVPVWVKSWRNPLAAESSALNAAADFVKFSEAAVGTAASETDKKQLKKTSVIIFFSCILFNLFIIICVYLLRYANYGTSSFKEYLEFWKCLDSQHYLNIAEDWYLSEGHWDRLVQLVFLPGYPVAVRLMNFLVNNFLYSGLIVSSLCFAGAGVVFYRLLRLDYSQNDSVRAVRYLCIFPGAFFFVAPMSESLFLLTGLLCIYFARKRKWFIACLFGGYAAFTRSLGIVLTVPVFFELICSTREQSLTGELRGKEKSHAINVLGWIAKFSSLLIIASGFASYCIINYLVSGDFMKFSYYQEEHWGQSLGMFFNTASYQFENLIGSFESNIKNALGLWLPNVVIGFAVLLLMLFAVKKIRASYTAYFLVYYMVAIGTTWLLSAPRYMLTAFPVVIALSVLTKKREYDTLATIICCTAAAFYLYAFVMRWQVW